MAEIINTRCKQGRLIITETQIIVELGNMKSETMLRSAFVGLESKMVVPAIFGFGGGVNLIFHSQGSQSLTAYLVSTKDAKKVKALFR